MKITILIVGLMAATSANATPELCRATISNVIQAARVGGVGSIADAEMGAYGNRLQGLANVISTIAIIRSSNNKSVQTDTALLEAQEYIMETLAVMDQNDKASADAVRNACVGDY